jgi:glycosyltransferase involved in cell wall biosynthesis
VRPDELLVGQVARFDPVKRQEDLIAAIGLARTSGLAVQAVFAGDGPTLPLLRASAADRSWLHFLGNTHDVPGLLAALDVFVLCSDHEAAPRALLEALAAGCPAVVTEVGGMPHVVGAGTSEPAALLVPPRSPEALATALGTLSDPNVRTAHAARARTRAEAFSSRAAWEAYAALWRDSSAGPE